jgi:hypothetical protein
MGHIIRHFIFGLLTMTLAISIVGCSNGAIYSGSSKSNVEKDQASVGTSTVRGKIDDSFDRNLLGIWNYAPVPAIDAETGRQAAIFHMKIEFSENNGSPTATVFNTCEGDDGTGPTVKAVAPIVLSAEYYEVLSGAQNSISTSDAPGERTVCSVSIDKGKYGYQVSGDTLTIMGGPTSGTLTRGLPLH